MQRFPKPYLKYLHPYLARQCTHSAFTCILALAYHAKKWTEGTSSIISNVLKDIYTRRVVSHHQDRMMQNVLRSNLYDFPFTDHDELYMYRQTAQYFMCWWTMRKDNILMNDYWDSCTYEAEGLHGKKKYSPTRTYQDQNFSCAMFSFCPDPCCPFVQLPDATDNECFYPPRRTSNSEYYLRRRTDLPYTNKSAWCLEYGNKKCHADMLNNVNFEDLIRNKINVSCDCEAFHKGYVFNSELKLCVDFDECYEGLHSCDMENAERCVNTLGSYLSVYVNNKIKNIICHKQLLLFSCACMKGYKRKNEHDTKSICVRDIKYEGDVVDEVGLMEAARMNKLQESRTKCAN
ncbi:DgyrCDS539 [Dimorphilus gyrociliatus]|uniref:DgyrCDS539 n=1 Tax=Dimorphilus gyrociliatus TaxID=2664684 RepID=A0A7I8V4R9_9ANNE|nr:DgyrCDS539 [Dimorphilus gyrociliatus]